MADAVPHFLLKSLISIQLYKCLNRLELFFIDPSMKRSTYDGGNVVDFKKFLLKRQQSKHISLQQIDKQDKTIRRTSHPQRV